MVGQGDTLSFDHDIHDPSGKGKWYSIKEYSTLNCMDQNITLKQELPTSDIESPFEILKPNVRTNPLTLIMKQ